MTLSSAFLSILSAACIAAVAGRLLIAACTAITRPDDALAAVIRWAYHVLYAAQSGQLALAHYRHARDANRARLAEAMGQKEWENRGTNDANRSGL